MKKSLFVASFLLATLVSTFIAPSSGFSIVGVYPALGPTIGGTKVTIYSPYFQGLSHATNQAPKCQFGSSQPNLANWIHCYGSATPGPDAKKDQTCLTCTSPEYEAGVTTLKVSVTGAFDDTAVVDYEYYQQPTLISANPALGYKTGGTFIQVTGQNFGNYSGLTCGFGTIEVPATYVSPTLVTCKSPPSEIEEEEIPLRVSQNGQQYTTTKIDYYAHAIPQITSLLPNEGPISGGTVVYIRGRQMAPFQSFEPNLNYQATTFARFGDHVVRAEIVNTTHIKAVAPSIISPMPVIVEITFNNQEWTHDGIFFYYFVAPYVVQIVPNLGIIEGGTRVIVLGANIRDTKEIKCRFGENIVPGNYINETSVWCIAPAGAALGPVDFSLATESNHFSAGNVQYTYIKTPTISTVTPACGPTTGGTQIALTGSDFVYTGFNRVSCIFGDQIWQPATVISDSLIYCESPVIPDYYGADETNPSATHVKVSLNGVEVFDSGVVFNYYDPPVVTSITPEIGPIEGDTLVTIIGQNFGNSCDIRCRFATYEAPATLNEEGNIECKSPAVAGPGESLVQITLNGQQYSANTYQNQDTVFTHYTAPIVAYALPLIFTSGGNSSIGVYGNKFLLSKATSQTSTGETAFTYQCRFKDSKGKVVGQAESSYFTDTYIHCRTPKVADAMKNVGLEISPEGQTWIPVPSTSISFYNSPQIDTVEPTFGKIKQQGATIKVNGRYFECQDDACANLKCSFSGSNFQVVTKGVRKSSTTIICDLPVVSRPEETLVQISVDGVDYTAQKVYYTFYSAFVVNVNPAYVPVEGNIPVRVYGFGFANTGKLQVRLENSKDNSVLYCSKSQCVFPATYISTNELEFTIPAQNTITTAAGSSIGFTPIEVEVSVYGDEFTNDNVPLNFYHQPQVGQGSLAENASVSYEVHANDITTIFIPTVITIPEGVLQDNFLRRTRVICKFTVGTQVATTEGKIVEYPYPTDGTFNISETNIQCPTPALTQPGTGTVSVALNGQSFVGNLPYTVLPQLTIVSVAPTCGPREGGTVVNLELAGLQEDDYSNVFFSWSSVCTNPFTPEMFTSTDNFKLSTTTPASPDNTTAGGASLVIFSALEKVLFDNGIEQKIARNHFESSQKFLYYKRPVITRIYPHGGIVSGGTPVIIEGAFFFTEPNFGCTPKCIFGNTAVDAEFISSVRLRCIAPKGQLGVFAPLTVSFNGQDSADAVQPQQFAYYERPNIKSISPIAGPSSGGTLINIKGEGFVDLSQYPQEFTCTFTPLNNPALTKITPASFINSSAIACSTPGGWEAGDVVKIAVSFNGVDFSQDVVKFRFYQVNQVFPLSGPSSGGSIINITGSGLVPEVAKGPAACKIGNQYTEAVKATSDQIQCRLPPALQGEAYHGQVDFYYTLDGEIWAQVIQGFTYYQQPTIDSIVPKFISENGGKLRVQGQNLVANFYGATPVCKIDDNIVTAEYAGANEIDCVFDTVTFNNEDNHYLQISLNNASFTNKTQDTQINIFKVSSMKPPAGLIEGGTQVKIILLTLF